MFHIYRLVLQYIEVAYGDLVERISIMKEYKQTLELEKIKIPVFYGNVEEWASFHDLFKKFVHENQQLPKVENIDERRSNKTYTTFAHNRKQL